MQMTLTLWEVGLGAAGLSLLLIGVAYLRKKMRFGKNKPKVKLNYIQPQHVQGEDFVQLLEAESQKALHRIQKTVESEKMQFLRLLEDSDHVAYSHSAGFNANDTAPGEPVDDPYKAARQYAQMGMAAREIAVSLNIPMAEAELAVKVVPVQR